MQFKSAIIFILLTLLYLFLCCREVLVKELESGLQQKKEDIARFEEERTDLIAKVHKTWAVISK